MINGFTGLITNEYPSYHTWWVQDDKIVLKSGPNTLVIKDFCELTRDIIKAAQEIKGHSVTIDK